jgi:hypothetical protein
MTGLFGSENVLKYTLSELFRSGQKEMRPFGAKVDPNSSAPGKQRSQLIETNRENKVNPNGIKRLLRKQGERS